MLAGLALVALVDVAWGTAFRSPDPFARFAARPQADRVFFLGDSLFRTAFDFPAIGRDAGLGYTPPFGAHVGHYTNFWYLYVTAGFRDVKPSLVVWGFRPTYANRPGFRKREFCGLDVLRDHWDTNYVAKTASAPLTPGERFEIALERSSWLLGQRDRAGAALARGMNASLCSWARRLGPAPACDALQGVGGARASVADLVQRFGSGGAATLADQRVVDAGAAFVTGERVTFDRSFVPDIAARLQARSIPQLVVIFKPVAYTKGSVPKEERDFVEAALRHFDERAIPSLNLVDDPRVQRRHFADGDHYNGEGRALMTALMAAKLRAVLAERTGRPD